MLDRHMVGRRSKTAKRLDESPKDDPQRNRVYAMERSIVGWCVYVDIAVEDLQDIADYVCAKYKIKRVGVTIRSSKKPIYGWCEEYTIHLNEQYYGATTGVLVHELAHYVCDQLKPGSAAHGGHWLTFYGEILDMLNLFPFRQFASLCYEWGLSFEELNDEEDYVYGIDPVWMRWAHGGREVRPALREGGDAAGEGAGDGALRSEGQGPDVLRTDETGSPRHRMVRA